MGKTSAAERQRLYRMRRDADPDRRQAYLANRRETYKNEIKQGKRKLIGAMTERDRRYKQTEWRMWQRESRMRRKEVLNIHTPPASPPENPDVGPNTQNRSRQKQRGRRAVKASRSKVYKDNASLERQLEAQIRLTNKYKTRWSRVMSRVAVSSPSPRTKTKRLLKCLNKDPKAKCVKKTLNFHYSLLSGLRAGLSSQRLEKERMIISRFFTNSIIKKYKLRSFFKGIGVSQRILYKSKNSFGKMCHFRQNAIKKKKAIREFYIRDDNSRMTTGLKNYVSRKGIKKQRRILLDSIMNIYIKFLAETNQSISYAFFCKQRPFWVVPPRNSDRETCLCKTHENLKFIVDKLFACNLIPTKNLNCLVEAVVCNIDSKSCAYNQCQKCKSKAYPFVKKPDNSEVVYFQWMTKKLEYSKAGQISSSTITVKEPLTVTQCQLVDEYQMMLDKFKKHSFNIKYQFNVYKELKQSLMAQECLIHIDFSENYNCKYSREIQSVHFGGSHKQASLHTGVLYVENDISVPFCTISDSRRHDPPAIWAHLEPVLKLVKQTFPNVSIVHFFSDGPSTQYKQKGNFYLMSTEIFKYGFKAATWNFFESSHGKGAPDGVGGSIKRSADNLVKNGIDIPDAKTMFLELSKNDSSVKTYFVEELVVDKIANKLSEMYLKPVKGTKSFHQVISITEREIFCRCLSCICSRGMEKLNCSCFSLQKFSLSVTTVRSNKSEEKLPPHGLLNLNPDKPVSATSLVRPDEITIEHLNKWVGVLYDGKVYPGQILEIDDSDIKINCMHRVGKNRYFWPKPRPDISWYADEDVVCFIEEPKFDCNKRYVVIEETWGELYE